MLFGDCDIFRCTLLHAATGCAHKNHRNASIPIDFDVIFGVRAMVHIRCYCQRPFSTNSESVGRNIVGYTTSPILNLSDQAATTSIHAKRRCSIRDILIDEALQRRSMC